ncbi:10170_t:CDS:2 [Cetraspora pellucida]|uniref:10170_t:CDS:1 n=1 Tax=Cetraspora pellucida TaxID=1433469 RepID=A0A9N9DXA8_9GLOM|nr:10170_t:CDS:2 [Cetraspora pellucida]
METCLKTINSTDDITGSNACDAEFRKFSAPWIIGYVLGAIVSIYFAFVVSAYATQCKNNERIVPLQTDTGKNNSK